jgi:hypothetical protein
MVYKLHIFNFRGFEAFQYFVNGIIPERLNDIRTLEIQGIGFPFGFPVVCKPGSYPDSFRAWNQTWSTVATMKGLSRLTVIIEKKNVPTYDAEERAAMFKPLQQIRQVKNYEICLNWEKQSWDFEPESGPYRITRPALPNPSVEGPQQ